MKIIKISNSCFIFELSNNVKILTDPWFNGPCNQTWYNFPPINIDKAYQLCKDVDYIYISHVHDDHLHKNTLSKLNKDSKIIIGKLNTPSLKNKILESGFKNIIEFELNKIHHLSNFDFYIFNDFHGNSIGEKTGIDYDLDTSLLIKHNNFTVFNAVDNSLLPEDSKKIKDNFGKIDLSILPYSAASLYPMAMKKYTHETKKNKKEILVKKFLDIFYKNIDKLNTKLAVPAGGESCLGNLSTNYNQYVPKPTPAERLSFAPDNIKNKICELYFGDQLDLETGKIKKNDDAQYRNFSLKDMISYSKKFQNDQPEYLMQKYKLEANLDNLLEAASQNHIKNLKHFKFNLDYEVNLEIKFLQKNIKWKTSKNPKNKIKFVLDEKLLFAFLSNTLNWNNVESSCLIDVEREPDKYYTDIHLSMVFFKCPELCKLIN